MVACVFAACSGSKDDEKNTGTSTAEGTNITTDEAKITDADAVRLIESYDDDELGLTSEIREECSFMIANSGTKIEDDYYIKVIAAIKTEHDEDGQRTYTFDNKGEYYIRYDGEQILSLDMETGEYSEMKVKDVPTTAPITTQSAEKTEE